MFLRGFKIKTVDDVLSDRSREEHWFLLDDGHVLLEVDWVEFSHVLLAVVDGSYIWVVETLNKLDDCGFTTAGSSDQGDRFVFGNSDVSLLNDLDILPSWVFELDILE